MDNNQANQVAFQKVMSGIKEDFPNGNFAEVSDTKYIIDINLIRIEVEIRNPLDAEYFMDDPNSMISCVDLDIYVNGKILTDLKSIFEARKCLNARIKELVGIN